jgi:hypothetical protein
MTFQRKRRANETHRADAPDPGVHVAPGQLARVDEGAQDAEGWGEKNNHYGLRAFAEGKEVLLCNTFSTLRWA